jgi:hypothetical protein
MVSAWFVETGDATWFQNPENFGEYLALVGDVMEGIHTEYPVYGLVGNVHVVAVEADELGWGNGAAKNGHFVEQETAEIEGGLGDIDGNGGALELV